MDELNNKAELKQSRRAAADARAAVTGTRQTSQRARQHQPTPPDAPDVSVAAVMLGLPRSDPIDSSTADTAPTRGAAVAASLIVASRTDSAAVLTHDAAVVQQPVHSSDSQLDAFGMFNALARAAAPSPPGKRAMQSTRAEAGSLNQSDATMTAVMLGATTKRASGLKEPAALKSRQSRSKSASNGNRGSQGSQTAVPSAQASGKCGGADAGSTSELDGSIARRQQRLADRRQKLKAMGRSTGNR